MTASDGNEYIPFLDSKRRKTELNTDSMPAVWYERTGPARSVLVQGTLPRPVPGAGEVRVRMGWAGVNPSDVKRRDGWNGQAIAFPRVVPGNDGSGVIDAVGDGVAGSRVGERVWLHSTGWKRPLGTTAGWTVTPAHRAAPLPEGVPLHVGAALGVPALTAHRAVHVCGPVQDRTVLVTGAAGAVGLYAVQLARAAGARILGTVSGAGKAALAMRAGCEATIDRHHEDVAERVLALTAGQGADHVVEVDFGGNLPATVRLLRAGGSIAAYASMAEPQPTLPFYALMTRNVRLAAVFVYEVEAQALRDGQEAVGRWLAGGDVVHPPFLEFPLEAAVAAHESVESGALGKTLVRIAGDFA